MFRISPHAFVTAALSTGLVWAQADNAPALPTPPAPSADAEASAAAEQSVQGDASGNAGVDANANADAGVDTNSAPAPGTNAGADVDAGVDVNQSRSTVNPRVRARGNANLDTQAEPRSGARANARGRAGVQGRNGDGKAGASARTGASIDMSRRPALGVTFRTQGDAMVISRVYPNSPAARMGLRMGDRIVGFNGQDFDDTQLFIDAAGQASLDEDAEIIYLRDGQTMTRTVRFAPWTQVFVDDDDATSRRVLRPGLDDADDLEDAVEDGVLIPAQPAPGVIPSPVIPRGEVEIDDDGVEIDRD